VNKNLQKDDTTGTCMGTLPVKLKARVLQNKITVTRLTKVSAILFDYNENRILKHFYH